MRGKRYKLASTWYSKFRALQKLPRYIIIQNHSLNTSVIRKMYTACNEHSTGKDVHIVDMRSDTLTKPTPLMREAMFNAEVGDDVYGEDPTVTALELKAASILGKEAALFVPSGTMGNLIATMVHCDRRGCEIIVGDMSHMFKYEQGGTAQIAGVQICTIPNKPDGTFDLEDMESHIRGNDIHEPVTALVCVENTHNLCGGKVLPLEWLEELAQRTDKLGIPLHMDGARLFNAAIYLSVPASHIAQHFASINFCLSKGLGAPVGSMLVGSKNFIQKARRFRKVLGGGMRQAGIIAAAGIVALDHVNRLVDDHRRASRIAQAIVGFGSRSITVDLENLHTNILLINLNASQVTAEEFCQRLSVVTENENMTSQRKTVVKISPKNQSCVRLVTHEGISDDDVDATVEKLKRVIDEYECV